jgi:hypothetical protein
MRKIEAHRDEETRRGRPKNEALISRIDTIWLAPARSRFTDEACLATHASTASAKRVELSVFRFVLTPRRLQISACEAPAMTKSRPQNRVRPPRGAQPMDRIVFTANIQRHVACPEAEAADRTVREVLKNVFAQNPQARGYVLDDQSALR